MLDFDPYCHDQKNSNGPTTPGQAGAGAWVSERKYHYIARISLQTASSRGTPSLRFSARVRRVCSPGKRTGCADATGLQCRNDSTTSSAICDSASSEPNAAGCIETNT